MGYPGAGLIQLYSGRYFSPFDPREEDILIQDIAHHLSNICRFTGAVTRFMSVAQHSVHVSYLVPQKHALQALLHDASEAYLCDLPKPIKELPDMEPYRKAEDNLQRLIFRRFKVPEEMHPSVHKADMRALATEFRDLMANYPLSKLYGKPDKDTIVPLTPTRANQLFMTRYHELTAKRVQRTTKKKDFAEITYSELEPIRAFPGLFTWANPEETILSFLNIPYTECTI